MKRTTGNLRFPGKVDSQGWKRVSRVGCEPTPHGLEVRTGSFVAGRGGSPTGSLRGIEPLAVAGVHERSSTWLSNRLSAAPPPAPVRRRQVSGVWATPLRVQERSWLPFFSTSVSPIRLLLVRLCLCWYGPVLLSNSDYSRGGSRGHVASHTTK